MPGVSAIIFGAINLDQAEIKGKRVIDVGSYDFNGSIRPLLESWKPSEYIGVDILEGQSVDIVCNADNLVEKFGKESFDVVVSLEMLEHSINWQLSISNIKNICKPGGIILITTRSYGYPCHGYPNDFWRYEIDDMKNIFADCEILSLEKDYQFPGVFIKVRKPLNFVEKNLDRYEIYSMVTNQKSYKITEKDLQSKHFLRMGFKEKIKGLGQKVILKSGKLVSRFLKI